MDFHYPYPVAIAVITTVIVLVFLIWICRGIYKAVILAYFTNAANLPAVMVNPESLQQQEELECSDGAPPASSSSEEEN
jgi:hypothetical protein